MKSKFQPAQHALLISTSDGRKLNGTATPGDLAQAKSLASSILRLMPQAAFVDVKPFVKGQLLEDAEILVRIGRSGQTVPVPEDEAPS